MHAEAPIGIPAVDVPERVHRVRSVLLWQLRGATDCVLDGRDARLAAGHALWIPPGVRHALQVHADSIVLPALLRVRPARGELSAPTWIAVDEALATQLLALQQSQHSIIQPAADLERRVVRLLHERSVPGTRLPMPRSGSASAIAALLRDDPADPRPLSALAEAQHVSVRTVERAFRNETGLTVRAWRERRRMELAAALLRGGDDVTAVAQRVGYRSPSAFRRVFREHEGTTPGAYRSRHRAPARIPS